MSDPSALKKLPVTYQSITEFFEAQGDANPFILRKETFLRIQKQTLRPLICYVAKTNNLNPGASASIEDADLIGFSDLVNSVKGKTVDVFIVSNGGSAEATERIVNLIRERFTTVRFIVPANAYSAATLLCFSGDEIIMESSATLGPIDPQINGIPARAILKSFEAVEKRLQEEGPAALTAYVPLISKYDLHIFEICRIAQDLSEELAKTWLSKYMKKCDMENEDVLRIVNYFSDYDVHKSHGRSINRNMAKDKGLNIVNAEDIEGLSPLIRSLYNQYELWFDKTPFYKMFENAEGINWGRQFAQIQIPIAPSPGIPPQNPPPGSATPSK